MPEGPSLSRNGKHTGNLATGRTSGSITWSNEHSEYDDRIAYFEKHPVRANGFEQKEEKQSDTKDRVVSCLREL